MEMSSGKLLVLLIVIMSICAGIMIFIAGLFYPQGFVVVGINPESTYTYGAVIESSAALSGVTMFLPLPAMNGNSPAGISIADGYGVIEGSDVDLELFGDKDAAMLKVSGDTLKSLKISTKTETEKLIDTQNPLNDCIFVPNIDGVAEVGSLYSVNVYLKYDCPDDTVVDFDITAGGKNAWSFLGDKENSYETHITFSATGAQNGWTVADAYLSGGSGDYKISI